MITFQDRAYGALLGLAFGDAIGFPSLFHRMANPLFPEKRRNFLWRINGESMRAHITTLMIPFTHRVAATVLEPSPTDDTEWALLTLDALLASPIEPTADTLLAPWLEKVVPAAESVWGGFAEKAAIANLQQGLRPPATGNDNAQHYSDSAVARAVSVGLFAAGYPERAARIAALDAQITHAEDGIWAAQAMAAAISVLAGGGALEAALFEARAQLPPESWVAHGNRVASQLLAQSESDLDLSYLLGTQLINTVYSYGNAAPETLPAALAIVERCEGDLQRAVHLANTLHKSADSLPAMVGTLCGAMQGPGAIPTRWRDALQEVRGLCLPFLAGRRLDECAQALAYRSSIES
jgi:ADP-ribosylglycohydrolase